MLRPRPTFQIRLSAQARQTPLLRESVVLVVGDSEHAYLTYFAFNFFHFSPSIMLVHMYFLSAFSKQ